MALTVVAQDNFTDTAGTHLLDHVPDVGGSWVSVPNLKTDGIKIFAGIMLTHQSPYHLDGVPYYVNSEDFLNGYVQAQFYCWNQVTGYRIEIFGRYNPATGERIRIYPSSDGYVKIEDFPDGSVTTLACTGSWLKSNQKLKLILSDCMVWAYYKDNAAAWALLGSHTTALLETGKSGVGIVEV